MLTQHCPVSDGATTSIKRRSLTIDDMDRMRIPERYWEASFDQISGKVVEAGADLSSIVRRYIENMDAMRAAGCSMILHGANGTGKTCASVVIAKEYRRRGHRVLFISAAELRNMVIRGEMFDDSQTMWERAKTVDVLVIDDFGKGGSDSTGYGMSLFDDLIRARNSRKLVTLITANLSPNKWEAEIGLKRSTVHTLRECTVPVMIAGVNRRNETARDLKSIFQL